MLVELGYKNGLDGMSLIHSCRKRTKTKSTGVPRPTTRGNRGYTSTRSYPCPYRKNVRLFPCCSKQLDEPLQADSADIRQAKNRQIHEDRYLRNLLLQNRFLTVTSSATNALGHSASRQTVASDRELTE